MPVVILEKGLVPDSGGPGTRRGGLGQRMRARRLESSADPITIGLYPEGHGIHVQGLFGGLPGGGAVGTVKTPDGKVRDVTTGETVAMADERLEIDVTIAGGSGFGPPHGRAIEDIAADLENGYITAAGAARDYGCVMTGDGRIDIEATLRHRERAPTAAK
jgi:5-oxoprolinase (ATP-hydrolysing)/N-methylhydantoinase A